MIRGNAGVLTPAEVASYVSSLEGFVEENGSWRGPCPNPNHPGKDHSSGNFNIYPNGVCKCWSHGCVDNLFNLHQEISGISDVRKSAANLFEMVGRPFLKGVYEAVATHVYRDAAGEPRFEVVRKRKIAGPGPDKKFSQRHRDAQGEIVYNVNGVEPIPYNLPEVLKAEIVFVAEGEKCADALSKIGLIGTCNAGGAGKWKPPLNEHFSGRDVVILPDNDQPGRDHALLVASNLFGIARSVKIVELPNLLEKGDVHDWLAAGGTKDQLLAIIDESPALTEAPARPEDSKSLTPPIADLDNGPVWIVTQKMTPEGTVVTSLRPVLANGITAFNFFPEIKDALAWDEFQNKAIFKRDVDLLHAKAGEAVADKHVAWITDFFNHNRLFLQTNVVGEALYAVAQRPENIVNPPRDHFNGLVWDGKPRIETWLTNYLGVEDSVYARAVGKRWLVSVVARVMWPGCKVDTMLILEGPQGFYKSSAARVMAIKDEWFTDHLPDISNKDAAIQLHGKLIVEVAELDVLRGRSADKFKAFLSTASDTYRPPYGKATIDVPRQSVFIGTTNDTNYLVDETGGRRYWPITIPRRIDLNLLRENRDQLWAEAVLEYKADEPRWWLLPEEEKLAKVQQSERLAEDPWRSIIEAWCESPRRAREPNPDRGESGSFPPFLSERGRVLTSEILEHCLEISKDKRRKTDEQRVTAVLKSMFWTRGDLERVQRSRVRFYHRPAGPLFEGVEP